MFGRKKNKQQLSHKERVWLSNLLRMKVAYLNDEVMKDHLNSYETKMALAIIDKIGYD